MTAAQLTKARDLRVWEEWRKLQGTWVSVAGRRPCRLTFAEQNFVAQFEGGDVFMGVYTVDPVTTPGAMDMEVVEGPEKYKGLTTLCLYTLEGETLRWCPARPGEAQRPAALCPDDPKGMTYVFRRDGF